MPEYRTIVDGIWSDILDNWLASFQTSAGTTIDGNGFVNTEQRVAVANAESVANEIYKAQIDQLSLLHQMVEQLRVLNGRFEEAFETRLQWQDVDE